MNLGGIKFSIKKLVIFVWFAFTGIAELYAQELSFDKNGEVISKICNLILENYLDEKDAIQLVDSLKHRIYNEDGFEQLSRRLTRDLRQMTQDQHFRVFYEPTNDFSKTISNKSRMSNYGFEKVEIMDGNIGYLRLSSFEDIDKANDIAHASLCFLSNSDAIIIDIRDNNGGRKSMVQLLLSYFFPESKHLFSIIGRKEVFHGYSEVELPWERLVHIPLYILINEESFSAAEMFAFILKHQSRAVILGRKSAGGGHTVANYPIIDGLSINIPVGRVVDPDSGIGWERVGVNPDINLNNNETFVDHAHLEALKDLMAGANDSLRLFKLNWLKDILESKLEPITLERGFLKSVVGTYGRRIVSYSKDNIYYQGRKGIDKARLIPINSTTFRFNEVDYFRIKFIFDEKGKCLGLKGIYNDQFEDYSLKTK